MHSSTCLQTPIPSWCSSCRFRNKCHPVTPHLSEYSSSMVDGTHFITQHTAHVVMFIYLHTAKATYSYYLYLIWLDWCGCMYSQRHDPPSSLQVSTSSTYSLIRPICPCFSPSILGVSLTLHTGLMSSSYSPLSRQPTNPPVHPEGSSQYIPLTRNIHWIPAWNQQINNCMIPHPCLQPKLPVFV